MYQFFLIISLLVYRLILNFLIYNLFIMNPQTKNQLRIREPVSSFFARGEGRSCCCVLDLPQLWQLQ